MGWGLPQGHTPAQMNRSSEKPLSTGPPGAARTRRRNSAPRCSPPRRFPTETLGLRRYNAEQPSGDFVRGTSTAMGTIKEPTAQALNSGSDERSSDQPAFTDPGKNGVRSPRSSFQSRLSPDSSRLSPSTTRCRADNTQIQIVPR